MLGLFTFTIFVGAAMLFLVQPMIAKMVLPMLGGSPSVWNTCMVFFQAILLAGYAYAHFSVKWFGVRMQVAVHVAVVLIPLVLWVIGWPPIAVPSAAPSAGQPPAEWLLGMLLLCIGPSFFVLSTCGTLMQRWFAATGHPSGKDPYFLYAASNAGSMLALLGYPLLVEPWLTLGAQRLAWSIGYILFAAATVACAILVRRKGRESATEQTMASEAAVPWGLRFRWVALAAVPSSLMLAVTQYLSTDIAAVPLLWIVPLAIYLLTFILAFAGRVLIPLRVADRTVPILVLALSVVVLLYRHDPIWIIIVLNLGALFFGGILCHGQLAASRPDASGLTTFYLCLAIGGMLGGLFNALVAPLVFNSLMEYPLVLAALCLLRPGVFRERWSLQRAMTDIGLAMTPIVLAILPEVLYPIFWRLRIVSVPMNDVVLRALTVGIPLIACYFFVSSPIRFAAAIGALLVVDTILESRFNIAQTRTFFGRYTVRYSSTPKQREMTELLHGTTLHGAQWLDAAGRPEPLIYYHRSGPIGDIFRLYNDTSLFDRVALVGLGAGSVAAYGRPGQVMTFFEIDPAVVSLARDRKLFHYLEDCKAKLEFTIGDARQSLSREPGQTFGVLVLDAFSSDAVPVHLLTREAVQVYMAKLKPGGVLAFHVSNRYLDLERVVSGVSSHLGLAAAIRVDEVPEEEEDVTLHWDSTWIAVARTQDDLAPLLNTKLWTVLRPKAGDRVWSDDYSSFVGIFDWGSVRR